MKYVRIGDESCGYVRVGERLPLAVMAEIGLNHNGDPGKALELVDLAVESGADLVKFQYIDPPAMVHRGCMPELFSLYGKYALSLQDMRRVALRCRERKIPFVCTVFDLEGAARMFETGVCAFKVASCDMTHLPLLRGLGAYALPVILSTGLSELAEVSTSVRELKRGGCKTPILLHCISAYPTPPEQTNLTAPALAAVLGACMVEKHFTDNPKAEGPDHALSLGPQEFRLMVDNIRIAEAMRGDGRKKSAPVEKQERRVGRRGYYLLRDVKKGEKVRTEDLVALKPWTEFGPFETKRLRGAVYSRDLAAGSPLSSKYIQLPKKG